MARKRNSKPNKEIGKIKKQKTSIVSRLMHISLKVDDYVYKGISISPRKAALFIKEVNGYRDICVGDKRCLQVIEKMERCMKGIIDEQNESQNHNDGVTNNCTHNSNNLSVDEHDICKKSNILQEEPTNNTMNNKEDKPNHTSIPIDKHDIGKQNNILIDVHGLANKISILKEKPNNTICNKKVNGYDTTISEDISSNQDAINQCNFVRDEYDTGKKFNILTDEHYIGKQTLVDINKAGNQRNIPKDKSTNNTVYTNKVDCHVTKIKVEVKNLNKPDISNRSNIPRNKHAEKQSHISKTGNQSNISKDKPTNKSIYTKINENNLSWIDNLKYVREISAQERIPVYYQDSFWESCTLPNDWTDEMFQ